MLESNKIV